MEDTTLVEQLKQVRDSGRVNMFDMGGVQRAAADLGLEELVAVCDSSQTYANALMRLSLSLQAETETNPAREVDTLAEL